MASTSSRKNIANLIRMVRMARSPGGRTCERRGWPRRPDIPDGAVRPTEKDATSTYMRRTARDGTARREDGPDGEDGSGGAAAKTAEDDCPMPGIPNPRAVILLSQREGTGTAGMASEQYGKCTLENSPLPPSVGRAASESGPGEDSGRGSWDSTTGCV